MHPLVKVSKNKTTFIWVQYLFIQCLLACFPSLATLFQIRSIHPSIECLSCFQEHFQREKIRAGALANDVNVPLPKLSLHANGALHISVRRDCENDSFFSLIHYIVTLDLLSLHWHHHIAGSSFSRTFNHFDSAKNKQIKDKGDRSIDEPTFVQCRSTQPSV